MVKGYYEIGDSILFLYVSKAIMIFLMSVATLLKWTFKITTSKSETYFPKMGMA